MNTYYRKPAFPQSAFPHVFKIPATTISGKNEHVETLRGLAIILVVFGHMIGYSSTGGMRVSDDSIFRYLYYTLEYLRLPLFTVISGWVYANKPLRAENQSMFISGKLRRLLIPMIVMSTLLFLFRMVIPGTNSTPALQDLPKNLFLPYDVYWYLFSLFLIFLVIAVLDQQRFFHKVEGWALAVFCSFVFLFVSENLLDPIPNIFSFKGAAYLLPFFLLGIGIYRYGELLLNDRMTLIILGVLVAGVTLQQIIWFRDLPLQDKTSVLGISVGIAAALLLFRLKFKNQVLIWIGNFAYGIFLFHVFFTGGTRILLMRLGVESPWTILLCGVIFSILFSILIVLLVSQSPALRLLFLGTRQQERIK